MQRLLAIAWLTWKAAFRFRLFLVIAVLLLAAVIGLPLIIKDDGTARGFTQILLTYTLTAISAFLGLSTLWLACGTLARDIEECQLQMVAVKPIPRWEIWLGKWLGIISLDAVLLTLSGVCLLGLLQWRATRLPVEQQKVLRNEVLVARGSVKPPSLEREIDQTTEQVLKERLQKNPVSQADLAEVRKQIREQVKAEYQVVRPGYMNVWKLDLSSVRDQVRDRPLQLRIKFNAADKSPSGTFEGWWLIGEPRQDRPPVTLGPMSLAPDTFHEFAIPPNMVDEKGLLTVAFANRNETALLFPLDEGMEVLYREGGFTLNFARGLAVIFCWMAVLAALGLASASFLSFPVAAFFSLGVLSLALCSSTIANAVSEGTIGGYNAEKGTAGRILVDPIVIPVFSVVLKVINLAKDFSPVDSLSSGRSITWSELARAFGQIVLLLGGILALIGMNILERRELATAQGTQ